MYAEAERNLADALEDAFRRSGAVECDSRADWESIAAGVLANHIEPMMAAQRAEFAAMARRRRNRHLALANGATGMSSAEREHGMQQEIAGLVRDAGAEG